MNMHKSSFKEPMAELFRFPILLFLFVLFFSDTAFAQDEPLFERDSVAYHEFVIDMMKKLPKEHKERVKVFEEEFSGFWFGGNLTETQRDTVYGFTNRMMKQRFMVYPTFYHYLKSLETLVHDETLFSEWHSSVATLFIDEKYDEVRRLISASFLFFSDKSMYRKSSINWKLEADTFRFVPDPFPGFRAESAVLKGFSDTDTMRIRNTEGVFDILAQTWAGQGGEVYWKRAGYAPQRIKTLLNSYSIDLTKSYYDADSVAFYDNKILDNPVSGKFRDGYVYVFDSADIRYPQFVTDEFFSLDSLVKNAILNGYLSYEGDKVLVSSKRKTKASADMRRNDETYMSIYGDKFFIKSDRFFARNTSVSVYIGENDSIYHPSIRFEYDPVNDNLTLLPRKGQSKIIPYSNSYHKMDMYCRMMEWDIQDSILRFSELPGMDKRGNAVFESYDFYSKQRFYNIQLYDKQNPLMLLNKFMVNYKQREFHLSQFADFTDYSEAEADLLMMRLAAQGFVIYDRKYKIVSVKDKLLNYIKAWYGMRDYDVMHFVSNVEGKSNAELNLKNFDLEIRGIPVVYLSDSQRVFIYPKNNRIVMKKDRDFEFAGRLIAGNLELFGQKGYFNYDAFNVDLPTIDSMRINLSTGTYNPDGSPYYQRINTVIENLDGNLQIDKPDNKSGLKPAPKYPILNSTQEASAFYDKYSKFVGVYDRNRFEYHVKPFTIDSVDNFNPKTISFDGYLESSIFPDISEPLMIQEDFSLGFKTTTPKEGFDVYDGKGTYQDSISLSNQGLKGKGKLNYLAADAVAEDVIFFPDSTNGLISDFHLKEMTQPTQYPLVQVESAKMRWLQNQDSMIVYEPLRPFAMYQNQVELNGLIALTPDALKGKGVAGYDLASVNSDEFSFRNTDFFAETSDVELATADRSGVAVRLENYDAFVDVATKAGEFLSEEQESQITFPYNQYLSYLNEISWDVSDKLLEMNVSDISDLSYLDTLDYTEIVDEELAGAKFVSTKKEQDSLQFFALKAKYDLRMNLIEAEKVKYINVADAAIFPFDEKLRIGQNAAIETLEKAKILTSTANKAHFFEDATVDLQSRNQFKGSGTYQFEDGAGEPFDVYFADLHVEEKETVGVANISVDDEFRLSPRFDYYGPLKLQGGDSLLSYDGYFRIDAGNCRYQKSNWVKFVDKLDPKEIEIFVDHPITDTSDAQPLYASLQFSPSLRTIYPLFFSPERIENDYPLWKIDGELSYHESEGKYRVTERAPATPDSLKRYLEYDPSTCEYRGLASIDFGVLYGRMNIEPHGEFVYDAANEDFGMRSVLKADFLFSKNALKMMADSLSMYDLDRVNPDGDWFERAVAQVLSKAQLNTVLDEINLSGLIRNIPKPMAKTMFFTDVTFEWNHELQSFIAAGKLGLGNIGDISFGRFVNGVIEIQPTSDGGNMNIYIEPDDGVWYFFTYSGTLMEALSSDQAFNIEIDETKRSKRYIPAKEGKKKYQYDLSGTNLKEFFLQRIGDAGVRF